MHTQTLSKGRSSNWQRFLAYLSCLYKRETLKSQVRLERDQLSELTERELRDLGVTREQAMQEARRGFNDVPQHRDC